IDTSYNQLENYKENYLSGKDRIAELQFNKAVDEIKKSGNLEILGRAYLTKYAVHVAVLEVFDEKEYLSIEALEAIPQNRTFYNFLKGSFDKVDESLLPKQYNEVLKVFRKGTFEDAAHEISKMEDPLPKLIAAGLLIQKNIRNEAVLKIAIDTAAQNGWKKALLAYLEKLALFYETKKESEKAAHITQKILLLKK
ncbi:MAG: hypothetical protein HGA41_08470, partial [Syntrophaceae bacterium]|nr:hypothetical protein [Syntrophaceae bacterium]